MESLDSAACFMDDLLDLDFGSDIGEEDDEEEKPRKAALPSLNPNGFNVLDPDDPGRSFPYAQEVAEEELEWLSNKDAFPAVETFVGIMSDHPVSLVKQQSPVSVLENSTTSSNSNSNSTSTNGSTIMSCCGNLRVPVRARSKRRRKRRRDLSAHESWGSQENVRNVKQAVSTTTAAAAAAVIGRKCLHCGAEKTPQWRAGPMGPKTLCNACGVRFKSGRLVPEYRPASSPTFSSKLHSNSHRKIVEMRKQKQVMGMVVVKPMDKG